MTRNKDGNRPTLILELKDFNINNIVYSLIDMFSIFYWDNIYKDPKGDKELKIILEDLQEHIFEKYIKGEW